MIEPNIARVQRESRFLPVSTLKFVEFTPTRLDVALGTTEKCKSAKRFNAPTAARALSWWSIQARQRSGLRRIAKYAAGPLK